jgi:hypothetical protein
MTNKRSFAIPNQGDGRPAGCLVFDMSVIYTTSRPPDELSATRHECCADPRLPPTAVTGNTFLRNCRRRRTHSNRRP